MSSGKDRRCRTGECVEFGELLQCRGPADRLRIPQHRECPGHREGGAGTLLMAGLAMVALLLIATTALMLQSATGASKAATAADLAALAAADAARGITAGEPCAVAAASAEQHGAQLAQCEVSAGDGTVVVRVVIGTAGPMPDATGSARAGPPG